MTGCKIFADWRSPPEFVFVAVFRNEVVIAVGTMTIEDVFNLPGSVLKVRYCHGISENQPELTRRAWGLPMPTICVSKTLAPVLKDLTGAEPLTVIPNGINATEYFEEDRERLGVARFTAGTT